MNRAAALVAVAIIGLLAAPLACRDAAERPRETADTAALQDRRIFEGEVGRDTEPAMLDTAIVEDTAAAAPKTFVLAADSAAGFLLYHRSAGCIACHGERAAGLANLGPDLRDTVWLHIDGSLAAIEQVIRTGVARPREAAIAMPGLASRLDSAEVRRISAYVYSLSHPGVVVADSAALRDSLRVYGADTLAMPDSIP